MMEEATASMTNEAMNNDRYAADNRLHVEFYYRPRIDAKLSDEAGHPVHKDTLYVKITPPGGDTRDQPVDEITRQRFAQRIAQFEAAQGDYEAVEGFRLTDWAAITRAQAEDLRHMKIFTVEQLSTVPDVNIQGVMGAMGLKKKAQDWLEEGKGSEAKLQAAEQMIADMKERLDALEDKPKRRGRPPKAEPVED